MKKSAFTLQMLQMLEYNDLFNRTLCRTVKVGPNQGWFANCGLLLTNGKVHKAISKCLVSQTSG
jgi:hypothetical protein